MPAPKQPIKVERQIIVLPVTLLEQMRQHLFDDEKGRIPRGSISDYISELIRKDLNERKPVSLLDLLGDEDGSKC